MIVFVLDMRHCWLYGLVRHLGVCCTVGEYFWRALFRCLFSIRSGLQVRHEGYYDERQCVALSVTLMTLSTLRVERFVTRFIHYLLTL